MARIDYDLTKSAGWSSLSYGSHNITIVAKADGYRDSEPSAAVSVTKAAAVTLIDFTIDDSPTTGQVQYQAEEGMTWQEWVNSSYNTNNSVTISTYDNYVRYKGRQISDVTKDNVIIANKIYKINTGSSGGGID